MVTCWERVDLLALLYVMLSCVFVTFPYGVLRKVWYLIFAFFLTLMYSVLPKDNTFKNILTISKLKAQATSIESQIVKFVWSITYVDRIWCLTKLTCISVPTDRFYLNSNKCNFTQSLLAAKLPLILV